MSLHGLNSDQEVLSSLVLIRLSAAFRDTAPYCTMRMLVAQWSSLRACARLPGRDALESGACEWRLRYCPEDRLPALARERRFIGIAFRVQGTQSQYSYFPPANGRADDQVRRDHFDSIRSVLDLEPAGWTKHRIVVDGRRRGCSPRLSAALPDRERSETRRFGGGGGWRWPCG